jgi:hypothetical protein
MCSFLCDIRQSDVIFVLYVVLWLLLGTSVVEEIQPR